MTQLARAGIFLVFALLAARVATGGRVPDPIRRRRVNAFLLWTVIVAFAAGVTQRDLWPFSHWRMVPVLAPHVVGRVDVFPRAIRPRLVGVTAAGTEYRIDYRAWEPFTEAELATWLHGRLREVSPDRQARIGTWLLAAANAAREAVRRGDAPGYVYRRLGPFTAPSHFLHRPFWHEPFDVPAEPFARIRIYDEHWDIVRRAQDPAEFRLDLLYEYPAAR